MTAIRAEIISLRPGEQSETPVNFLDTKLYGTSLLRFPRDTAAFILANFVMYIQHSLPGSLKGG